MREETIEYEKQMMKKSHRAVWIAADAFAHLQKEGYDDATSALSMLIGGVINPMADLPTVDQIELLYTLEKLAAERRGVLEEAGILSPADNPLL